MWGSNWEEVGAYAGGLEYRLARVMFDGAFGYGDHKAVADFLDALADLPEHQRTLDHVYSDETLGAQLSHLRSGL